MRIEDDNILEVGETVTVRLGRSQNLESRIVLNPVNGVIRISDNDGVLQLLCTLVCRFFFKSRKQMLYIFISALVVFPPEAVVGLEKTFYCISEDAVQIEVCAIVYFPVLECPIDFAFAIGYYTRDDSAG